MSQQKFDPNLQNAVKTEEGGEAPESPWKLLGWGVVSIAIGVGAYLYLADLESRQEETRIHVIVAILYKIGGKNLTAGVFIVAGALILIWGIIRLMRRDRYT